MPPLPPFPKLASNHPLILDRLGDLQPLRAALIQGGYTPEAVAETLGIQHVAESIDLPVLLRRTREPLPFHTLFRLFYLGQSVSEASARQALAPMPLELLGTGGLLARNETGLFSTIKIVPHEDLFFASDFSYPARSEPMAPDHVLGVGPASMTLAVLTMRAPVESTLDIGCGAGVQSVLASRHSQNVVGTDINPRALNLAAFNARLNGIPNLGWRLGSFFEPVADQQFDLVVANPPFVISPQSALIYRDSGMKGDGVSEFVLKGCAGKLKEGGYASLLINWHHQSEEDWEERPRQWAENTGCDCWIIRSGISTPLTYAASWLRFQESRHPERYGQLLDEWLEYFQSMGIQRISAGAVILRKRSAATHWVRCDCADNVQGCGSCSPSIQRVFAAEDLLQRLADDSQLLEERLAIHPDLIASQRLVFHQSQWASESITLSMREGFPFSGKADIHILQLLAHCDGQQPLRALIQSLAHSLDTPFSTIAPACLQALKKLLRSGMVVAGIED